MVEAILKARKCLFYRVLKVPKIFPTNYRDTTQFREIYEFRSDLVHGNIFKKEVLDGHLRVARSFARRTLLWFLHYLKGIQDRIPQDQATESIPTRDDVLMLLDLDKNSRLRLSRLIGSVPEGFPYVREWVE